MCIVLVMQSHCRSLALLCRCVARHRDAVSSLTVSRYITGTPRYYSYDRMEGVMAWLVRLIYGRTIVSSFFNVANALQARVTTPASEP